jgi:hypothetical protein
LHVDLIQPAPVCGTQGVAFIEKGVLFSDERFNMLVELLIVHTASFTPQRRCYPRSPLMLIARPCRGEGKPVRTQRRHPSTKMSGTASL